MSAQQPSFYVVIPARYESTRLPGKPLLPIAGKPMVLHVCDRALEANASQVIVATDDERIFRTVSETGVKAVMTRADHNSGTDRLAEVADKLGWPDSQIVVNVQGDEPLISPELINDVAMALADNNDAVVSTLGTPIIDADEVFDPNVVKIVVDRLGYALYFSRAPIPWDRDHFQSGCGTIAANSTYLRHIGIYGYTAGFLNRYVDWPPCSLEQIERLEQLRILWNGERVRVVEVSTKPEAGVDTEADLRRVAQLMKSENLL